MDLTERVKSAIKDYAQFLALPIPYVGDYIASSLLKSSRARRFYTAASGTMKLFTLGEVLIGNDMVGCYSALNMLNIFMYTISAPLEQIRENVLKKDNNCSN